MNVASPFPTLPSWLAEAFSHRGFSELTTIQKALLAPQTAERDLRMCSATGSGKTVAIGMAVADLVQTAVQKRQNQRSTGTKSRGPTQTAAPAVLLIAPTRELAAQLGDEFEWMFAALNPGVCVITGGVGYRDQIRALSNSPLVVIGTPGRLVDHLKKGTIVLESVLSLVLDEADEMMDMGFREELESIMVCASGEHRTHMVSATFNHNVLNLAKQYQKDAFELRGTSTSERYADVEHIVHLIYKKDRTAAIINRLLLEPDQRTLIFVRMRVDTTQLAEQLTRAGFDASPLNGDMEQAERTRTMNAFRRGRPNILVATDVAARGIDIPEIATVIHADCPEDIEALTHRSGRTGRAGRRGTNVILATSDTRARLINMTRRAKIDARWCAVPTPKEIDTAGEQRLIARFESDSKATVPEPHHLLMANRLLEQIAPAQLVARLLAERDPQGPCPAFDVPIPSSAVPTKKRKPNKPDWRSNQNFLPFSVNWGSRDGADVRKLLAIICRRGKISSKQVGAIDVRPKSSVVQISANIAAEFALATSKTDRRDPDVRISLFKNSASKSSSKSNKNAHSHRGSLSNRDGYAPPRRKTSGKTTQTDDKPGKRGASKKRKRRIAKQ